MICEHETVNIKHETSIRKADKVVEKLSNMRAEFLAINLGHGCSGAACDS